MNNRRKRKVCFLYQIHNNNELVDYARKLADQLGCKVFTYTESRGDIEIRCLLKHKKVLTLFKGHIAM